MTGRSSMPCCWLVALAICAERATAQPPVAESATPATKAAVEPGVRRVLPRDAAELTGTAARPRDLEVFYVADPDHPDRLRPLVGFTAEQLRRLWSETEEPPLPPAATIDRLELQAQVRAEHAEVAGRLDITVGAAGWVSVPLGLNSLVFREPPRHTGEGSVRWERTPQRGWQLWIKSQADTEHRFDWSGLAPIGKQGDQRRWALALPTAAVSRVKLAGLPDDANVSLPSGDGELTTRREGTGTTAEVTGAGGDCEIAWRPQRLGDVPIAYRAQSNLRLEATRDAAQLDCHWEIDQSPHRVERVRLRVPAGAELEPVAPAANAWRRGDADARGAIWEIALPESEGVSSELACRVRFARSEPSGLVVSPPELLGAARQTGYLALVSREGAASSVGWTGSLVEIDAGLLPPRLQGRGVERAMAFHELDFRVQFGALPPSPEPRVTAVYVADVGLDETMLRGTWRIETASIAPDHLDVETRGWTIRQVEPGRIEAVEGDEATPGTIRIRLPADLNSPFDLTWEARREHSATLDWQLPAPRDAELSPALITLAPRDNVELEVGPMIEALWSAADAPTSGEKASVAARTFRGSARDARVRATIERLPQQIETRGHARVVLDRAQTRIEQTFELQVRHAPAAQFVVVLPTDWRAATGHELAVDDEILPSDEQAIVDDGVAPRWTVRFDPPRLGNVKVSLRWRLPPITIAAGEEATPRIHLATPADGGSYSRALVNAKGGLRVAVEAAETWQTLPNGKNGGVWQLEAAAAPTELMLRVWPATDASTETAIIERALLETIDDPQGLQHRWTLQVTSKEEGLRLEMPDDWSPRGTQLQVDGAETEWRHDGARGVRFDWPESSSRGRVVELTYFQTRRLTDAARIPLVLPRVDGATLVREARWWIGTSSAWHVVEPPEGWLSAMTWRWQGLGWRRVPDTTRGALATWVGASSRGTLATGAHEYLFRHTGARWPETARVELESRSRLVLLGSGAVLLLGLALLYRPGLVRPATLFGGGLALAASAALWPEWTILFGQSSAAGLLLLLLATRLARRQRPARPSSAPSWGGSSIRTRAASGSRPPASGKLHVPSTADAAPLPEPVALSDSQS